MVRGKRHTFKKAKFLKRVFFGGVPKKKKKERLI